MALLETCFCCSLAIAAGFIAVYLLIGYVIAFAFELLWLLESEVGLPVSAALLCGLYFIMSLFGAFLVHGLATKNTLCLLAWMFSVTILSFPEAGMVIYMSIQYWSIESLYGMTELVCWLARVLANVFGVVIVQSLYANWKEEELVLKRLQNINMTTVPRELQNSDLANSHFHNNAYAASIEHFGTIKRNGSSPNIWSGTLPNNLATFQMNGLAYCTTTSEFNASIYVPNFAPPNRGFNIAAKRTQSLMDLRNIKEEETNNEKQIHSWDPWMTQSLTDTPTVIPTYTFSLDRKLSPRGSKSMDNLNFSGSLRSRNSFFEQASHEYGLPIYYGPLHGPDFLVFKKQISKNSLSNTSDDLQKYRDVAL